MSDGTDQPMETTRRQRMGETSIAETLVAWATRTSSSDRPEWWGLVMRGFVFLVMAGVVALGVTQPKAAAWLVSYGFYVFGSLWVLTVLAFLFFLHGVRQMRKHWYAAVDKDIESAVAQVRTDAAAAMSKREAEWRFDADAWHKESDADKANSERLAKELAECQAAHAKVGR